MSRSVPADDIPRGGAPAGRGGAGAGARPGEAARPGADARLRRSRLRRNAHRRRRRARHCSPHRGRSARPARRLRSGSFRRITAGTSCVQNRQRLVHGRSAAGGWSQHRFARRREKQAAEALDAAAAAAVRVFGPYQGELDAVVLGGDRRTVASMRDDPRVRPYLALATDRFLTVPDPRLAILRDSPRLFRAIRIRFTEAPSAPQQVPPEHHRGLRRGAHTGPANQASGPVSGRCAGEVPPRGAERVRGVPGGRPPGQHGRLVAVSPLLP